MHDLFCTRPATAGSISSDDNHPFEAGNHALAHKGHRRGWLGFSGAGRSDTQTAEAPAKTYGPGMPLGEAFAGPGIWTFDGFGDVIVIPRARELRFHLFSAVALSFAPRNTYRFLLPPVRVHEHRAARRPVRVEISPIEPSR